MGRSGLHRARDYEFNTQVDIQALSFLRQRLWCRNASKTARHLIISPRQPTQNMRRKSLWVSLLRHAAVQHLLRLAAPVFLFRSFVGQLQKTSREGNQGLRPRLSRGRGPLPTNTSDRNSAKQKCLWEKMGRRGLRLWDG